MIVCDSRRFVFVHVQKTGGVTVTNTLKSQLGDDAVRAVDKRHAPLARILEVEPELSDYWVFGFVRNPWDRMVSWWSMITNWKSWNERKGRSIEGLGNEFWRTTSLYQDFEEFCFRGPDEFERMRRAQVDFLVAGERRADFIGRTETLTADSRTAFEHLGLSLDSLGHDNRSSRTDYRDYYSPTARDRVGEVFAKDVAEFGYEF